MLYSHLDTLSVHNGSVHFQNRSLDGSGRRQFRHTDVDSVRSFMIQHDNLLVLVHLLLLLFANNKRKIFGYIEKCFARYNLDILFVITSQHLKLLRYDQYFFTVQQILRYESTLKTTKTFGTCYRFVKWQDIPKTPLEWDKRGHSFDCKLRYI